MSAVPRDIPAPSKSPPGVDAAYAAERAKWVDRQTKDTLDWGHQQAESLWEKLYAPYDPIVDGRCVLDLGCSWGYLLKYLAERFNPSQLTGVDIKPWWETTDHGWDYSKLGDRLQFHAGDLADIWAIPPESLDLILCTSVLQYMKPEQIEANLCRAYDLLRPGGEMLLRTRVYTSYIGADLHRDIELPYAHLLYPERELAEFVRAKNGKEPPYLNWLTASTYLAIFVRSGFEILDCRRRMNKHAPAVMERVAKAYPWISPEELFCAEIEARLVRPLEPEDIRRFGRMVSTRVKGAAVVNPHAGYDVPRAEARLDAALGAGGRPFMIPMRRPARALEDATAIVERDEFVIQAHPAVKLNRPVTWLEDPLSDRNWRFWFQSGAPISTLLQAYQSSGDARYLSRAAELVDAWICTSLDKREGVDMTWHDHATAMRAMTLLYFWEVWRESDAGTTDGTRPLAARVLATLIAHARVLANETFYMPQHNHGLDQARALLALALNLRETEEAADWEALSRRRVEEQIRDTISADGVHFEHTPDYQGHVYRMLAELDAFLSRYGQPWPLLCETMDRMMTFLAHCLKPNGDWPNIGDTTPGGPANVVLSMDDRLEDHPEFQFALTGGRAGSPPVARDLVLPDSGYAIFRESWDARLVDRAVQIIFCAAYNTRTHKHQDDLSFVVHGFGRELLVDAGKYKYEYEHPMRQFCESAWGHNVVTHDGAPASWDTDYIGRSGIVASWQCGDTSAVEGEHHLYEGAVVRRLLVWRRPDVILVVDWAGGRKAAWRQVFNVAPEFDVCVDGRLATAAARDGGPVVRVFSIAPDAPSISLHRGEESPPRGWASLKSGVIEPTCSIVSAIESAAPCWVTLITLDEGPDRARKIEGSAAVSHDGMTVDFKLDGVASRIGYRRAGGRAILDVDGQTAESDILPLPYHRR